MPSTVSFLATYHLSCRMAVCLLAGTLLNGALFSSIAADDPTSTSSSGGPLALPLVGMVPGQKLLAIASDTEQHHIRTACRKLRMDVEFMTDYDVRRRDFRGYHAVLFGSNRMDYFGKADRQQPEAFRAIVEYVANGGHLIMFGTYHGRNMGHLRSFGIEAAAGGGEGFVRTPVTTEALFEGSEDVIPATGEVTYLGRFSISRPHVEMLGRKGGDQAIATTPFGDGRVTILMVEPYYKHDFWLFPVILHWHQRGAPTRLPKAGLMAEATAVTRLPIPDDSSVAAARETLQQEFESEFSQLRPWNATVAKELARKLLDQSAGFDDPARRWGALLESRALAEKCGDAATVLNIAEQSARAFQVDALDALLQSLDEASTAGRSPADARSVVDAALIGANEAVEQRRYDVADDLLKIATGNARRARTPNLPSEIARMKDAVRDARRDAP